MDFQIKKVNALPQTLAANTLYLVSLGENSFGMVATNETGTQAKAAKADSDPPNAGDIQDSTLVGRAILTAADADAVRTIISAALSTMEVADDAASDTLPVVGTTVLGTVIQALRNNAKQLFASLASLASYFTGGILSIDHGGTGASSPADARAALGAAPIVSPTFAGPVTMDNELLVAQLREKVGVQITATGNISIDVDNATYYYFSSTSSTRTLSLSLTNIANRTATVFLDFTDGGNGVFNWPASVRWNANIVPAMLTSGIDVVALTTRDNGITWLGTHWYQSAN